MKLRNVKSRYKGAMYSCHARVELVAIDDMGRMQKCWSQSVKNLVRYTKFHVEALVLAFFLHGVGMRNNFLEMGILVKDGC